MNTPMPMSKSYRGMIYFAVATLYFYRKDVILPKPVKKDDSRPEKIKKYEAFEKNNRSIIKRVCDEALSLFQYELSRNQIDTAIVAYLAPAQSVVNTKVATI